MRVRFKNIILLIIIMLILVVNDKVIAEAFPNSITNIYELTDLEGSLKGYTGNKRLIASGVKELGYYLGTQTQFLPYKVGDSTEKANGGISDYKYAVFCTLFGAASPAENSYSVLIKGETAPTSCTMDNSWNIGIKAGVGAIIGSVTPSTNRFYGNGLQDYYDAEIAINQFLYEKTSNGCNISNSLCGSAAANVSANEITTLNEKQKELIALAKVYYDKAMKLNDKQLTVGFPTDKELKYSDTEEIWRSEFITIKNLDKYSYNLQNLKVVLKDATGKTYDNYAYITSTNTQGVYQVGVCNNKDTNEYCKKINNFEPLTVGKYTVDVTISGKDSYKIAQNYSCGSNYQSLTPAFTDTKVVEDKFNAIFVFEIKEKTGTLTLEKVDENGVGLVGARITVIGQDVDYNYTAVLDKKSSKVLYGLPYGTYIVKEYKAPDGYVKDDTNYKVIISESNPDGKVTIENIEEVIEEPETETFKFYLLKVNEKGNGISGADFNITYGTAKQEVEDLSSGGITSREVEAGTKVCIEETAAPKGYKIVQEKFCFQFNKDGTVKLDDDYEYVEIYKKSSTRYGIKVTNLPEERSITYVKKIDATTNKVVVGATLKLTDKDGKEIETWETTKEPHLISGLKVGTYYIEEIKTPEGYSLNKTKEKLEVTSNSQVQTIEFKNTPIVKVPDTMINMSKLILIFGVIASFTGGLLIYKNGLKENNRGDL